MAITNVLLKLDNKDITKLVEYTVEYNKLWKDADRNMNGEVRASLIGIFPKIKAKTTKATRAEIASIGNILNRPYFRVSYYDTLVGGIKTANYYAGDFSVTLKERQRELYEEMSFSLIPVSKRV